MFNQVNQTGFSSWWGRHAIEPGQKHFWQIGSLRLWVEHLPQSWQLNWVNAGDWLDPVVRAVAGGQGVQLPSAGVARTQQMTCMFNEAKEELIFSPLLPERAVITHLKHPIHILSGELVSLYVLTPLWIKIEMAEPSRVLAEIPTFRMSDTWFGPMSRSGDLCYASPGETFLQIREIPLRLHCAITAIRVRNLGSKSLEIERIKVPLTRLSLFYSSRTGFWTDAVTLEAQDDSGAGADMASMKLDKQPPADVGPTQFVSAPRVAAPDNVSVFRAFSRLFRERT